MDFILKRIRLNDKQMKKEPEILELLDRLLSDHVLRIRNHIKRWGETND